MESNKQQWMAKNQGEQGCEVVVLSYLQMPSSEYPSQKKSVSIASNFMVTHVGSSKGVWHSLVDQCSPRSVFSSTACPFVQSILSIFFSVFLRFFLLALVKVVPNLSTLLVNSNMMDSFVFIILDYVRSKLLNCLSLYNANSLMCTSTGEGLSILAYAILSRGF